MSRYDSPLVSDMYGATGGAVSLPSVSFGTMLPTKYPYQLGKFVLDKVGRPVYGDDSWLAFSIGLVVVLLVLFLFYKLVRHMSGFTGHRSRFLVERMGSPSGPTDLRTLDGFMGGQETPYYGETPIDVMAKGSDSINAAQKAFLSINQENARFGNDNGGGAQPLVWEDFWRDWQAATAANKNSLSMVVPGNVDTSLLSDRFASQAY